MTLSHFEAARINFSNNSEYNNTQDFDSIPKTSGVRVWVGRNSIENDECMFHLWFTNQRWNRCEYGGEQKRDITPANDLSLKHFKAIANNCCEGWFTWVQLPDEPIFG